MKTDELTCFNCKHIKWHGKTLDCTKKLRVSFKTFPWWCYEFKYEPGTTDGRCENPISR